MGLRRLQIAGEIHLNGYSPQGLGDSPEKCKVIACLKEKRLGMEVDDGDLVTRPYCIVIFQIQLELGLVRLGWF